MVGIAEYEGSLAWRIKRLLTRPIPKSAKLGDGSAVFIFCAGLVAVPMAQARKPSEPPSAKPPRAVLPAAQKKPQAQAPTAPAANFPVAGVKFALTARCPADSGGVESVNLGKCFVRTDPTGRWLIENAPPDCTNLLLTFKHPDYRVPLPFRRHSCPDHGTKGLRRPCPENCD